MHESVAYIHEHGKQLYVEGEKSDALGRLTDEGAKILRDSGGMRLLQPKEFGGFESHPNDFLEWVMACGYYAPAAGWIAGVVGVHAHETALFDPRVMEEVWGEDSDVWAASPYAPVGRAIPVEGGFRFSGEWSYSTGTDHCQWLQIGGLVTEPDGTLGEKPELRHFMIPRADGEYEIVEGSWNTMGLNGTGSKNVRLVDVFVPEYRTIQATVLNDGGFEFRQPGKALYQVKRGMMFQAAIGAGTIGIAEGALNAYREHTADRVSVMGEAKKNDPFQLARYAEATSDIKVSRMSLLQNMDDIYQAYVRGDEVTISDRLAFRRDQVRGSYRSWLSMEKLFQIAGGTSTYLSNPLQRYMRDLSVAVHHISNVANPVYTAWGSYEFTGQMMNPTNF